MTSRYRIALPLLAAAGLAACEARNAQTGPNPAPEEVFVSEHGFRIPIEDKDAFLECVKGEDWSWSAGVPDRFTGKPSARQRAEALAFGEEACERRLRARRGPKGPPLYTPDMTPDEAACVALKQGRQVQIWWPDGRTALCDRATSDSTSEGEK